MQIKPVLHADPITLNHEYQAAEPFPHIVIDNLFDNDLLEKVRDVFPDPMAWNGGALIIRKKKSSASGIPVTLTLFYMIFCRP